MKRKQVRRGKSRAEQGLGSAIFILLVALFILIGFGLGRATAPICPDAVTIFHGE